MNTKDFLRLVPLRLASAGQGVPLGEATRRATDFVARFILGGGASGSADISPLHRARLRGDGKTMGLSAVVS